MKVEENGYQKRIFDTKKTLFALYNIDKSNAKLSLCDCDASIYFDRIQVDCLRFSSAVRNEPLKVKIVEKRANVVITSRRNGFGIRKECHRFECVP